MISLKTAVYWAIPILLLLVLFPAAIQPGQVLIPDFHDTISCMMPDMFLMQQPFALWNNMWLSGYPEISSVNTDRFYPLSFPITFFAQNIFVINLIIVIHLYIAFLAFNKLGSLVVEDENLLFLFSLGYMFFGAMMARVFVGHYFHVYALAWAPLIYYFAFKIMVYKEETAKNIIGLAVCETLIFMAGATSYYIFYINAILGVFLLYYILKNELQKSTAIAITASALLFTILSAIKLIPNLVGMAYIQRIDIIDPLKDGGSLFNNFGSFIFGTPIDNAFGWYETAALIGAIPVLLAIVAIIWGKRELVVPAFYAIVFSLIWADGGRIALAFIHLMPIVNSFRNAGRIFGAIAPVILLLALYGVHIISQKLKREESFILTQEQKRNVKTGVGILAIIIVLELPWFFIPPITSLVAAGIVFGFIYMIYMGKANHRNLLAFFSIALLINVIVLVINPEFYGSTILERVFIIMAISLVMFAFNREIFSLANLKTDRSKVWNLLILFSVLFIVCGTTYVFKVSDPQFNTSPAIKIIDKIKEYPSDNPQTWIMNTGWEVYHIDFAYHFIKAGYHPVRALYSFVPKNMLPIAINIGGNEYYFSDYLVDTGYLENGNQNLPISTFKVDNISVFKPEYVLPNAFVIREDRMVNTTFEKFSPDEIIITGQFQPGDVAVLKASFYPGWKINGQEAIKVGNMPTSALKSGTTKIVFRFDPTEAKVGIVLSLIGMTLLCTLIFKRRLVDAYLEKLKPKITTKKSKKDQKKKGGKE